MDFTNLESDETLQHALAWISTYIQSAIENKEDKVIFTFKPNKDNSLSQLFDFILKLKNMLSKYGFMTWCILNNANEKINMQIMLQGRNI